MDTKKLKEELNEVKASTEKRLEKAKANVGENSVSMEVFFDELSWAHSRINNLMDMLFSFIDQHTKSHAPHPKSAAQMNQAIKAFGMEEDIEVIPKKIFASMKEGDKESLIDFLAKRAKTEKEKTLADYIK